MAWLLLIAGGVMTLLNGVIDPYAPVNGLTLLGILTMVGGVVVAARS